MSASKEVKLKNDSDSEDEEKKNRQRFKSERPKEQQHKIDKFENSKSKRVIVIMKNASEIAVITIVSGFDMLTRLMGIYKPHLHVALSKRTFACRLMK